MTYLTLHRPARNLFRFYSPFFAPQHTKTDADRWGWAPSVDVSETADNFEVRAELPGVAKDDLHVSVKDNLLTLSGEKRQENVGPTEIRTPTGSGNGRHQSRIQRRGLDALHPETGSCETDRSPYHNCILIRLP